MSLKCALKTFSQFKYFWPLREEDSSSAGDKGGILSHLYILHFVSSFPFNNTIFPVWPRSTQIAGSSSTTISLTERLSFKTEADANLVPAHYGCQTGLEKLGLSELFYLQSHLHLGRREINSAKSWLMMRGQLSAKYQFKQPSRITITEVKLFSFRKVPYKPYLLRHNTSPLFCSLPPIFLWL